MSNLRRCVTGQRRTVSQWARSNEPLRVLFCGSDAFSVYSLRALNAYNIAEPSRVGSIDVVCRSDKRTGRGMKQLHAVPIKAISQELNLPLQQLDTFKGWQPINGKPDLIVTASFGLLVPADVLSQAKYGGLNVHPSLLPQFRGAAPIQHAILRRMSQTGVSIQTMHQTKFDHGVVLAQEAYNMHDAGAEPTTTTSLIDALGPIGGRLLVETIDKGLFLDPRPVETARNETLFRASKIQSSDRMIDWQRWTSEDIMARDRALDNLWDTTTFSMCNDIGASNKRIVFHGPWSIVGLCEGAEFANGAAHTLTTSEHNEVRLAFKTVDSYFISPAAATIEGEAKRKGLSSLRRALQARLSQLS